MIISNTPSLRRALRATTPSGDVSDAAVGRSPNPVLASIMPIVRSSRNVTTNDSAIAAAAKAIGDTPLDPAKWNFPPFIEENSPRTIQFFMLGNAINFKFWGKNAADRYATDYQGKHYDGAMAMWACLRRAVDGGVPILDAAYLKNMTLEQGEKLLPGIPMLKERVAIFNEVGRVREEKYHGSFAEMYRSSGGRAFNQGNGFVERLTRDFPSFRDTARDPQTGKDVIFNKRAQLSVAMLANRLKGTGLFDIGDLDRLTVFADYELPRTLHHLGLIRYSPALEAKIASQQQIPPGSRDKIEIRAHTIYAARLLELALKRQGRNVNALNVDYWLWSQGRAISGEPHHLTPTTAY